MNKSNAIVKWPGGKISEAEKILPLLPNFSGRFIDPFVGGGAIYFAAQSNKAAINDLSSELISLYHYIKKKDQAFFSSIQRLDNIRCSLNDELDKDVSSILLWFDDFLVEKISEKELKSLVVSFVMSGESRFENYTYDGLALDVFLQEIEKNLLRKLLRTAQLSAENGGLKRADIVSNFETALHSAFYMYVRHLYNYPLELNLTNEIRIATFYYIREFCYSSMFRFNKEGKFNVPYGGMAYNSKNFSSKIARIQQPEYQQYLRRTNIYNDDFSVFFEKILPDENDFIFLDPPYDSDFSTYDRNSFEKNDHERLAKFMRDTSASFMMVIKNTDFIMDLFGSIPGVQVQMFDKKYMVSFQNRNKKRAKHLIITNYLLPKQT